MRPRTHQSLAPTVKVFFNIGSGRIGTLLFFVINLTLGKTVQTGSGVKVYATGKVSHDRQDSESARRKVPHRTRRLLLLTATPFQLRPAEMLEILRCPMDPSHTALTVEEERLVCTRCRVVFPNRDGFPALLIEEAELPQGCSSIEQLPCQREK